MGRPRRPLNGVETIVKSEHPYLSEELGANLGVRQRERWHSSSLWAYRVPNGQLDPLTYMHILDSVASIDPDIELRAGNLTDWLNREKSAFLWDRVTVGKVLSDLHDAFEERLGKGNSLLERGKDYRGVFYLVKHTGEVGILYRDVREGLMAAARVELDLQAAGGTRSPRLESPLIEVPALRGEWVDVE